MSYFHKGRLILSSQVVLLPFQPVIEVANFCAAMDTLIDQDGVVLVIGIMRILCVCM